MSRNLLASDVSPERWRELHTIKIWVAFDERLDGWVLAHDGCREPMSDKSGTLSVCDLFAEELSMMSRHTDDMPFDKNHGWPEKPGLYEWSGRLWVNCTPSTPMGPGDCDLVMKGEWRPVHVIEQPAGDS